MTAERILAPLALTATDGPSLAFIINRYGGDRNVQVVLFHAYTPVPEIEVRNNPIMEKMNRNLSYQRTLLNDQKKALEKLKTQLLEAGFRDEQVHCRFTAVKNDVARDVIQLVRKEGFGSVVLSRRPGRVTRFFTRSVSERVAAALEKNVDVFILT